MLWRSRPRLRAGGMTVASMGFWRRRLAALSDVAVPAFIVLFGVLVAFRLLGIYPWNEFVFDVHTYWATRFGYDYATLQGPAGAYHYSPAFAQVITPLTALPLPLFAGLWTALTAGLLYWLTGRKAIAFGLLPPVMLTIVQGQLDLAFAAVVVLGFRWPAAWALPLLTKVTPGVGLIWFVVRREWRSVVIAGAATIGIIAVSALLDLGLWKDWFALLGRAGAPPVGEDLVYFPIPLLLRLPIAVAVVAWGAATDRRWTLPVAVTLGMPILWLNSPTILVAIWPMLAAGAASPAGRWLRAARAR